eukprot:669238-Alexandrium_andersonii.AAC.1
MVLRHNDYGQESRRRQGLRMQSRWLHRPREGMARTEGQLADNAVVKYGASAWRAGSYMCTKHSEASTACVLLA